VGKLLASVVSEPFFLGSPAHKTAVDRLPDCDMGQSFVDLPVDSVQVSVWPAESDKPVSILWRVGQPEPLKPLSPGASRSGSIGSGSGSSGSGSGSSGSGSGSSGSGSAFFSDPSRCFFKITMGASFEARHFRSLHAVYAALAAAWSSAPASDPAPASLIPAQLLYGAAEVCVLMPWVQGRQATVEELAEGGCAVAPLAAAVAWLARKGLLYMDLRLPNVLVEDCEGAAPAVTLIDYDDLVLLEKPPASGAELCELLKDASAAVSLGQLPALLKELRAQSWPE